MDKVGYPSWHEKWVCIFVYLLKNERKYPNFGENKFNSEVKYNVKMQESKCLIHP